MDAHRGAEAPPPSAERRCSEEPRNKCETDAGAQASSTACFDCNICLDFAVEPVVTLCGHLYCWPCIYRWLQQADGAAPQQCPVCKAALHHDALVPLYGGGRHGAKKPRPDHEVPRRPPPTQPPSPGAYEEQQYPETRPYTRHHHQHPNHGWEYMSGAPRVIHSTAGGLLGGLVVAILPWVFRNQEWPGIYYSSPYHMGGDVGSGRLRRQEMELKRSLHQIWLFLVCCAIVCLLLF
ncbi:hypothetical protein OPV22_005733 [Ensete ventricosum]|uniref:E3 ubiquitin-protein ligase RMA n=1 Tax=Ensete ventricosum TaxID=4639 RepID=A0AAV8Q9Z4_ENSVE|nr:hypothetical protein OPV22_005733 [Ensete ventricosum]RWW04342.1 hypothetical protein GW17_00032440 [Ensete ventricosum]RZR97484.1 hypothetical protein BHM03_00026681 [Ensete ventricosum]